MRPWPQPWPATCFATAEWAKVAGKLGVREESAVASERRVPSAEEAELGLVELLWAAVRIELITDYDTTVLSFEAFGVLGSVPFQGLPFHELAGCEAFVTPGNLRS